MELTTVLEISAIVLALLYVVLAAKESVWCWPPAFISSAIYAWITSDAHLVGETIIMLFYMAMAVYGWWKWHSRDASSTGIPITDWHPWMHAGIIGAGLVLSCAVGVGFERFFNSAQPYLDATTTVFGFMATYMVAKKILSNWLYWIAIDALNIYLYQGRDLNLTSGLYALYTVLALWGYIRWRKTWLSALRS
ncbi:MAG: nicotinamide riboside transporter PnuC [Flavobacteriales bacterium]|nr:nicotinamide riboside transporter PnuC [Flavobacteriales bacterium]